MREYKYWIIIITKKDYFGNGICKLLNRNNKKKYYFGDENFKLHAYGNQM